MLWGGVKGWGGGKTSTNGAGNNREIYVVSGRRQRARDGGVRAMGEPRILAAKQERAKIINECINQLGETCRRILMYYYFDGLSMQDIADHLGFANTNTAKTKKYKCKKKLDELVKAQYSEQDFLD